ncbi:MAG: ATP-binding protein [Thermoprotei archaeon]|nr:MAG: ATP-binding protein [Thermoprotei archaeon]RLE73391.1 MAG: ATP-binding protein [Thermoprotei archaeon]
MVKVVKVDGSLEEFDKEKIVKSCMKAGAPENIAREIADKIAEKVVEGTTTREIRTMALDLLGKYNPEWRDNWIYYDRIVKKRITYERGKFVEVSKGKLYLGREVRDVGKKGLSDVEEVKGILRELEEDLEHGIPGKTIQSRTYILFMAILRSKKLDKEEKLAAIEELNKFREKHGWKPYQLKRPLT